MTNSFTNIVGGLTTSISQDSALNMRPYDTLIVTPQSNATSATVPASPVTQKKVTSWVANTKGLPFYIQEEQTLWALTFPGSAYNQGLPICVLDCLRNVTLTFSTATTNATTVTINGLDDEGTEVVWTSASQSVGTTVIISAKCFRIVRSVSFTAQPWAVSSETNTVLVRGGTFIGLPSFINNTSSVVSAVWAGVSALPAIVPGVIWRKTPITRPFNAATALPSATSGDARGYVNITGLTAPNGSLLLHVFYYVYGEDEKLNKQLNMLNGYVADGPYSLRSQPGSAANIVQTKNDAAGKPMLTALVRQDRFGAQFPGDATFMEYYNGLYFKV